MEWETVIGLEVHVQLATKTKIFSGSSTDFGSEPNTQASLIDLGFPGTLPVLNQEVLKMAVQFGLATNATIAKRSVFDRKNYFYPDLPKGYQISQFNFPIVTKGQLSVTFEGEAAPRKINITRAHLEEDAGKSLHDAFPGMSAVDLNRAGTPLLEIVSEPELRSAKEAVAYLKKLHSLVCTLGICDGNMQEGSFRCDANVSVRPKGQQELGTRCEIKNVNSFRFVEKAINYEVERQIELITSGGTVRQQTRLYDAHKNETRPMRDKEEANDYRYFPDPDLLPVIIDEAFIHDIKENMPELPDEKQARLIKDYALSEYDADILANDHELATYFELALKANHMQNAKLTANWVIGELLGALNKSNLELKDSKVSATMLGELLNKICDNTISGKIAKVVFEEMFTTGNHANNIIEEQGLQQVTDSSAIEKLVDDVLANNQEQVGAYKAGNSKLLGFFVGQIMKISQGKANPNQVNEILLKKLS